MEKRVAEETQRFGDILRLDSTDTYADLASKTLKLFSKLPDKFDASFYFKARPRPSGFPVPSPCAEGANQSAPARALLPV